MAAFNRLPGFTFSLLIIVLFQLCSAIEVDREQEKANEELLKVLQERWSKKSVEEIIQEGAFGLPENQHRLAYIPKKDELDCNIRYLAYNYSKKLLSPSANLRSVADGLQLSTLCGINPKVPKQEPYLEHEKHIKEIKKTGDFLEFFVDPQGLHEETVGSFSSPFSKIESAIKACEVRRKSVKTPCIIRLRQGMHFVEDTLMLTPKHSHVLLTKYGDEEAVISGGKSVSTAWKVHSKRTDEFEGDNNIFEGIKPYQSMGSVVFMGIFNESATCKFLCEQQTTCTSYTHFGKSSGVLANMCYARKDGLWNPIKTAGASSGKRIKIYVTDLSGMGVKPFRQIFVNGKREVRARYPNGDPEKTGLHTVPTGYVSSAAKWLPVIKSEPAKEIHIKDPHRDRTPFSTFYLGIGGPVSQYDPPVSYWGVKSPAGGGGITYEVPSGLQFSKDLEFVSRKWSDATTGIIHAFQHYHWENWQFDIDARNETDNTFRWSYGGFQGARGAWDGKEWYIDNIFEELDVAGEWFLDEPTMKLYYFPSGSLPNQIIVPQIESIVGIVGTQTSPVKGAKIMGLTFAHTESTFMKKYAVPSGGDWSVHRNAMIFTQGTEDLIISGNILNGPGGNGIFISNYTRNANISDNYIAFAGDNGIAVVGHSKLIDGTNGNQPRGTKILRNVIHDTGVWGKGTYSYSQSVSCLTTLEGNVFFNGPRGSININDGFGGGNVITKNVLFNFVRETFDHGPFNSWDRVPYLTKLFDGKTPSLRGKENHISKTFIINNYNADWPITHDDGSRYWSDYNNYLVYGGFKNYLGDSLTSIDNYYIYPDKPGSSQGAVFCMDTRAQSLGSETFDHGPINTWDRVPYTTKVLDPSKGMLLPMENFVSKCLVISNYFSVWPIDHDDGSSYWADSYNFLTYGGWKNYFGHSKKALNNVYAYPDKYMSDHYCMDSRGQQLGSGASGWDEVYVSNTCILNQDSVYRIGTCIEESIEDLVPYTGNNRFYTATGNIKIQCGGYTWTLEEFQKRGFDISSTVQKQVGIDVVIGWGKKVLDL